MMLHFVLKNRYLFALCLTIIWISILIIPKLGQSYRLYSQNQEPLVQNESIAKVVEEKHDYSTQSHPVDSSPYLFAGDFQQGEKCLDTLGGGSGMSVGVFSCHGIGGNQFWYVMKSSNWLKSKDLCVEGPEDLKKYGVPAILKPCRNIKHQSWTYEEGIFRLSDSTLCLEAKKNNFVFVEKCNRSVQKQVFKLHTPQGF
ncbi:polypeptide N-acetylgalactosaminyltransferase 2 isoform X2 [Hydra vulgaris]|uniref:polypeptide N-acetylgalactosaminyltransferase 2 isoform X2 n=1 Tax=Hydra vulgaris TaxID=6087 RepID=UPI001F5EB222|nr:polypeptide N-acetylgalactosaminyltransferase 2 isoform X1 [Hydra vulgaris]